MRSSNNSNRKTDDIKSPLISKGSPESKSFTPHKLHFEYDKILPGCKTRCSPVCNKTAYKDFLRVEYEDKGNPNDHDFSINSLIIAIFTLFIFCFQITYYRKTINTFPIERFKNTHEFMQEYSFYCWRIQSVCIFLLIFIFFAKYLTKIYKAKYEEKDNNMDNKHMHDFDIQWRNVVNFNNLKFSFINSICYFIYFSSTKFLPVGVCLFLNSFGLFFEYITGRRNRKTLIKHVVFLLFGFVLLYYSLLRSFPELKYPSIFNLQVLSLILYAVASILCSISQRNYANELFTTNSPLTSVIVMQINTLILTTCLLMIIEIFHYKSSGEDIFIWLLDWDKFVSIFLSFGFLGLVNSVLIIFSTVYLSAKILKIIKIFEIPFSEFLAITLLEIYSCPDSYEYYFAIMNFTIYLAFILFKNKKK